MADRPVVSEVFQLAVESTAGTAATGGWKRFTGVNVDLGTALEVDEFAPMGTLADTIVAPRQEWAEGSVEGFPTYTDLAYLFANIFGAATITTPSGATNARRWLWTPDEATPWTPKTWTIQRGVPGDTAEQATYGLLSGLGLSFSRTAAPEISGDLFARRLDYAATLQTTGVTTLDEVPIFAPQVDVFLDDTSGGLGGTQLTRDFVAGWSIADLFNPIWPLNSSLTSFGAHTIAKPTIEATLQVGNDSVGRGLVTQMRAGTTKFLRIRATGPEIESGFNYRLTMDMAVKVLSAPSRGDVDGLSTLEWTLRNVYDSGWGKWIEIELLTDQTAL